MVIKLYSGKHAKPSNHESIFFLAFISADSNHWLWNKINITLFNIFVIGGGEGWCWRCTKIQNQASASKGGGRVQIFIPFNHKAVRTYVYSVGNFQFIMASQILFREQLEKMSNENLIASFLALQDNIILQQNDLLQQNRDISKKLMEITCKIDSLAKKNEEITSNVSVAQNGSKILQEAFKTTSRKLLELERQHHKLEQYTRRECLNFSSIHTTSFAENRY